MVALRGPDGDITVDEDAQGVARIAAAPNHPAVLPLVHNSANAAFNGPLGDAVLASPKARAKLIAGLADLAVRRGYGGYVFDLENLSPKGLANYPKLLDEARAVLKPQGREVWVTAPFDGQGWPLKALQDASDTLVLMAYDQHYAGGDPGPNAGQDWYESELAKRFAKLDPNRTILALGAYGYDWTLKKDGSPASGAPATFHEAMRNAQDAGASIDMDDDALNPTYGYQDDNGDNHVVWFLDAATLFNQVKVTDAWKPRGYGLWRMGMEDPGVWSVLGKPYGQASAQALTSIPAGQSVDFDGGGEVLRVTNLPTPGKRSLEFDSDTGLIADQSYDVLPSSYVIQRYGQRPGLVALTFDDGPDPRWTPKILDILKAKNAPATFFVIGENMQNRPDLVKREVAEGQRRGQPHLDPPQHRRNPRRPDRRGAERHPAAVRGDHRPLDAPVPPAVLRRRRAVDAARGHALLSAQTLGYMAVGLRIDTDDWQKPPPQTIIDRTLERLDHPGDRPGQVVLLHDAGGNRANTVKALPELIDQIRARGYRLVTVGELAGMTPQQVMPVSDRDPVALALDRMGFGLFRAVKVLLTALFLTAIALGLARLVFLACLALVHRWTHESPENLDPETGPLVSVLIPCFNEEKVIAASVSRILESEWKNIEVLVLDDGSKDSTAEEVRRAHGDNPRVTLLSFENGGKARAVNRGLAVAKGDYVVALDADTLFPPKTIGRLVRWFQRSPDRGGGRQRHRRQPAEHRHPLAGAGICHRPEPGAPRPGGPGRGDRGARRGRGLAQERAGRPGRLSADTLAEDQDLTIACQRAGWKVAFDPRPRPSPRPRHRRGPAQAALPLVVRHPAMRLEAPRGPVQSKTPGPGLRGPAAASGCSRSCWPSPRPGRPGGGVEPDLGPLRRARLTRWSGRPTTRSGACSTGRCSSWSTCRPAPWAWRWRQRAPWADLPYLPVQRFGYRQLMYYVVVKSVLTAAARRPRRLGKTGATGDRDGQVHRQP